MEKVRARHISQWEGKQAVKRQRVQGREHQAEEIDLTVDSPRQRGASPSRTHAAAGSHVLLPAARPPSASPDQVVIVGERLPAVPAAARRRQQQQQQQQQQRGVGHAAAAQHPLPGHVFTLRGPRQAAAVTAAAHEMPSEDEDMALARRLQEEEDRKLAQAEAALASRLHQLEAQEAAAAAAEPLPFFGTVGGFLRRRGTRQPAAGGGGVAVTGPRSRGRRGRWGDAWGDVLGSGFGHRGYGGHGAESNLLAMQEAAAAARRGTLPPQLLFSDRDFNEQDYEALLRLDESVANRKGAKAAIIDSIETVRVSAGDTQQHDDCAVCLEACRAGDLLRKLPCKHCYHKNCIDRWLQTKAVCPICQQGIA